MKRKRLTKSEHAQAIPEYSVLVSLVALIVIGVFSLIGPALVDALQALVHIF